MNAYEEDVGIEPTRPEGHGIQHRCDTSTL